MEKPKDQEQNNRRLDERQPPETKGNASPQEMEWDPDGANANKKNAERKKLKSLKDVRESKDTKNE